MEMNLVYVERTLNYLRGETEDNKKILGQNILPLDGAGTRDIPCISEY